MVEEGVGLALMGGGVVWMRRSCGVMEGRNVECLGEAFGVDERELRTQELWTMDMAQHAGGMSMGKGI